MNMSLTGLREASLIDCTAGAASPLRLVRLWPEHFLPTGRLLARAEQRLALALCALPPFRDSSSANHGQYTRERSRFILSMLQKQTSIELHCGRVFSRILSFDPRG